MLLGLIDRVVLGGDSPALRRSRCGGDRFLAAVRDRGNARMAHFPLVSGDLM